MAQDGGRKERSANRIERKPSASSSRVLVLAILAMQALASHGGSTAPEMNLTVTDYRARVPRACGKAEMKGARAGEYRAEGPEAKP